MPPRIIGVNKMDKVSVFIQGREDNQNLVGKPDNQKIKMFTKCQILINATQKSSKIIIVCTVVMTDDDG